MFITATIANCFLLLDSSPPQVLPDDPGHWLRGTLVHGLGFNPSVPVEHDVARLEFKTAALMAMWRFATHQLTAPLKLRRPQSEGNAGLLVRGGRFGG